MNGSLTVFARRDFQNEGTASRLATLKCDWQRLSTYRTALRLLLMARNRHAEVVAACPLSGGFYCKSRKLNDPRNLAKVDFCTSLLLHRLSTPGRRPVIGFGWIGTVPHIAARQTH